jgi:hypothetical protein
MTKCDVLSGLLSPKASRITTVRLKVFSERGGKTKIVWTADFLPREPESFPTLLRPFARARVWCVKAGLRTKVLSVSPHSLLAN